MLNKAFLDPASLYSEQSAQVVKKSKKNVSEKIADGFSKAAAVYDANSKVQKEAVAHLVDIAIPHLQGLDEEKSKRILDVGSGTSGIFDRLLQTSISMAYHDWFNLDLSFGMLDVAAKKVGHSKSSFLQADASALPFQNNCVDLVLSSMALQWCNEPQKVWTELERVCAPQARVFLAIMLPSSYAKLRNTWRSIGYPEKLNSMPSKQEWLSSIPPSFNLVSSDEVCFFDPAENFSQMLKSMKKVGANTVIDNHSIKQQAKMQKREFIALKAAYDSKYRNDFQLDYQILFLHLVKSE